MGNGRMIKKKAKELLRCLIKNTTMEPFREELKMGLDSKSSPMETNTKGSISWADSMEKENTSGPTAPHMMASLSKVTATGEVAGHR